MVTAGKIILRFLAKTETGVSPSSVRMVCCVCGFVVLWSERVVTGCMIFFVVFGWDRVRCYPFLVLFDVFMLVVSFLRLRFLWLVRAAGKSWEKNKEGREEKNVYMYS